MVDKVKRCKVTLGWSCFLLSKPRLSQVLPCVLVICLSLVQTHVSTQACRYKNMEFDYDLFVLGAGSGGVRASRMSASYGAKVAVAESMFLGGTCVNVGCVPKKLFVYGSHFHEEFQDAKNYGWDVPSSSFDEVEFTDESSALLRPTLCFVVTIHPPTRVSANAPVAAVVTVITSVL